MALLQKVNEKKGASRGHAQNSIYLSEDRNQTFDLLGVDTGELCVIFHSPK